MEQAIFAGGCFWCIEAVFVELRGVLKAESGYCGGTTAAPNYEAVCGGGTGHAEAVRITFDPAQISYADLVRIFFHLHDPTTKNRQGADVGTQYRSVIFYLDEAQHAAAEEVKSELQGELWSGRPFVTEIVPAPHFFPAEDYHQNYYANNSSQPYCVFTISPKLEKLKKLFSDKMA